MHQFGRAPSASPWTLVLAFLAVAGVLGLSHALLAQDPIRVAGGLGFDGVQYGALLDRFRGEASAAAAPPFCGRIGTALILSVLPEWIGYYHFNAACGVIFAAMMVLLAVEYCGWRGVPVMAALFIGIFLRFSPVRFINYYPAYMDPPFLAAMAAAALCIARRRYLLASFACMAAVPFREASIYIIPLIAAFDVMRVGPKAIIPHVAVMLASLVLRDFCESVGGCAAYSQAGAALHWLGRAATEPTRFISIVAALSMTAGPILFARDAAFFQSERLRFSSAALIYCALLSAAGGADTTRIFFSFVPLYAPLILVVFDRIEPPSAVCAISGWIISNHVVGEYQQPASTAPNFDLSGAFSQTPDHANPAIALAILALWWLMRAASNLLDSDSAGDRAC